LETTSYVLHNKIITILKKNKTNRDNVISRNTYPSIMEEHQHTLSANIQIKECKKALFDMGSHKALGEDGYPAIFFQKWDTNGEKTDSFVPTRGIRQGDPLSPYLFVICMEKLSHIIADQVDACYWKPMRAGRYRPQISHLVFVDDLLLFAEASIEQAHCVLHCLDMFCQASGQQINYQKTQVFF